MTDKAVDWKATLNLPKTEFPMRADLARREPQWLARWEADRQYERILADREAADAPRFVLHDGPPYPTGGIHYGTLLNKVLKDLVVRSQLLMGRHAPFVPGWDCHGLPIEHQIEQELNKERAGKPDGAAKGQPSVPEPGSPNEVKPMAKAGLSAVEFRARCEAHARKYVDVMRTEFKRLGCVGRWEDPYLTLSRTYESTIVRQLAGFARGGLLYRAKRPVQWCLFHQTALAEAEVEYEEHSSPSIYVRFPFDTDDAHTRELKASLFGDEPAALVIWTTTPWTLPANLAVVANPELEYVAIPASLGGRPREWLIVAKGRAETFCAAVGIAPDPSQWRALTKAELAKLEGKAGVKYRAPFPPAREGGPIPAAELDAICYRLYFAAHATLEAGTGLVHTAPGHGADDYVLGRDKGLPVYAPVNEAGRYTTDVAAWTGLTVFEANPKVVAALAEGGWLLNKPGETIKHKYPCCWRCKRPLIFRGTAQWFARLGAAGDANSLRAKALTEIDRTTWIPAWGRDRIRGMIEVRPDWCLSRQRLWGVPIPAVRDTETGEAFTSAEMMEHIAAIFDREGSNAWFAKSLDDLVPDALLPPGAPKDRARLAKGLDIVDVWFESGVSWAAVAEGKLVPQDGQVDLYLEGADQHRGWFHSSLLAATATRGHAPYKAVLTHGWVLDERGKVYSKSEIAKAKAAGHKLDYVDPGEWMQKNGAELLRLWTAASDYQSDVVFSKTVLDQLSESYRKVRNTCRYLLSNLYDFVPAKDALPDDRMREVDVLALGVLRERDHQIFDAFKRYAFHDVVRLMVDFCITTSAEYLDPVKDALYCEAADSPVRRSVQTTLHEMVRTIATWMAPILVFTAQDVADELARVTGETFDVHGQVHLDPIPAGKKADPNRRWREEIRPRREAILAKLEPFRAAGRKSLQAAVRVRPSATERPHWQWSRDLLTELTVVSSIDVSDDDAPGETEIVVTEATLSECPRCWRRLPPSGDGRDANLCVRCAAAVPAQGARA